MIQNATLFPPSRIHGDAKIPFRDHKKIKVIYCTYTGNEPITLRARAQLCAIALHRFYNKDITNHEYPQLLGPLLAILCTFAKDDDILKTGIKPAFKECHLQLEKVSFSTIAEIDFASKNMILDLCDWIGLPNFEDYPQVFVVIAVSLLILIGKNVVENNRLGWFKNR